MRTGEQRDGSTHEAAAPTGHIGTAGAAHTDRPEDDLALMRRVRARDDAALAALYDRYAAQVNGLARSILRDPALAEEATHDVFLRLWQHPEAYDPGRGAFGGWLLRVSRNRSIDLLRRRHEAPAGAHEDARLFLLADPAPTPEEQAISLMRREEVREALAELGPEQRHLIELAYVSGLSQREIAERLERPLGTVKSQIRAAMHRLADRLATTEGHR